MDSIAPNPQYYWVALSCLFTILLLSRLFRRRPSMGEMRSWRRLTASKRGRKFELWCARLLRSYGFRTVRVCGQSGDQGVDILARRGLRKYAIQCKCYNHALGNDPVQEINSGMEIVHASVGVVMTNATFTVGAVEAARKAGRDKPILLWDRETLDGMCRGYGIRPVPLNKAKKKKRSKSRKRKSKKGDGDFGYGEGQTGRRTSLPGAGRDAGGVGNGLPKV